MLKGNRTVLVALLGFLASILGIYGVNVSDVQVESLAVVLTMAWPIAMGIMRYLTTTPMGKKEIPCPVCAKRAAG